VGDAALSPDPLSGTGVVGALVSAAAAARAVRQLLTSPDDGAALRTYEVETDRRCTDHLQGRRTMYAAAGLSDGPFWARRVPVSS
jgi:flavin-dependent dehydrogenase